MATPIVRGDVFGDVEGLPEGGDAVAVGGIHGVQRFDGEAHVGPCRRVGDGGDTVRHLLTRTGQIARALRQTTADQHEAVRSQCGGFLDGAKIVGDGGAASRLVGVR